MLTTAQQRRRQKFTAFVRDSRLEHPTRNKGVSAGQRLVANTAMLPQAVSQKQRELGGGCGDGGAARGRRLSRQGAA